MRYVTDPKNLTAERPALKKNLVSVCGERAKCTGSQGIKEEGQIRVELAPPCTLKVVVNPPKEGRACERGDHNHVGADPSQDDVRPRIPVVVSLLRGSVPRLLLGRRRVLERVLGSGPECVNVFLHGRQVDGHHLLTILTLHLCSASKILGGTIVTFGTPRNIVQVAHSVHHQDVHICNKGGSTIGGWEGEGSNLQEGSKNMYWMKDVNIW